METPLTVGTCWSGNWTDFQNGDDGNTTIDDSRLSAFPVCDEIAGAMIRDPGHLPL